MATWLLRLAGDVGDLQALTRTFSTPDLRVIEEKGGYYLESVDFNSLTDAQQVLTRGREILSVASGMARLRLGSFQGAEANVVVRIHTHGPSDQIVFPDTIMIESNVGIPTATGGAAAGASTIQKWLAVVSQDGAVTVALRLYGSRGLDWVALYSVYEAIKKDAGGKKNILAKGWAASDKEIERFTQTANAISRHPPGHFDPPKKPMSLKQGRSFIAGILERWIDSKV